MRDAIGRTVGAVNMRPDGRAVLAWASGGR